MNFCEAKNYFEQLNKFGSVLGLDNIKELLKRLDNPQDSLKVIHVAGTNGKGSTIAFIESILIEAGYKVGVYTSPVVFDYLEKIRISGKYISEEDFAEEAELIKERNESMVRDGYCNPTIFESETAMAFHYFERMCCDIVIIETGMGGATDATNVCQKVVCSVITSVSLDHTAFLGESIEEIATVKAGIIKEECPVTVMNQDEKILDVFRKQSRSKNAVLTITGKPDIKEMSADKTIFDYISSGGNEYKDIEIHMLGSYQPDNAVLAIEAVEIALNKIYGQLSSEVIKKGLSKALWRGRFEKVSDEPLIFIDGAHNPGASLRLKESVDIYFKDYRKIYIMGVLGDKDYKTIIERLLPEAAMVYTITPHNMRGLDGNILAENISKVNESVEYVEEYKEALSMAKEKYYSFEKSGNKAVILAFGSLSYLNELRMEV
ncbi:MAG: bifunctional folylpolyglutamate synthase/dihydrofolate synthase [Lachnospiraceae bacterium]|nr:bifunctional folylpolyglutamate synthase/dihydrofolate synthase [Lachnospiraceae bacterium]